jgi:glycosyltransferase involved in cell wall biosynthesis
VDIIIPTILERDNPVIVSLIAEIIRTAPGHTILATCTNASASVNRNLGLDASHSDIVIMIDDDITGLPVGWADALEHTFRGMYDQETEQLCGGTK